MAEPGRVGWRPGSVVARVLASLGHIVAFLAGLALLGLASGLVLLSQTAAGRELTAALVEDALEGAMEGRVEVGPITGGNLVTRVVLERFSISEADGRPFLQLRDVRVEYNPLGFLRGRFHLRRVDAGRLDLALLQDAEGVWNFRRIFPEDTTPPVAGPEGAPGGGEEGGARLRIVDASVADGRIELRMPHEAAPGGRGDGEEIWRVEETPEGSRRVMELEGLSARLPLLLLADPERPMRLEFRPLVGTARIVRRPLELVSLEGSAVFGDTVRVEIGQLRTPASRLEGRGRVYTAPEGQHYHFDLEADPVAFGELDWLPIPVPAAGEARGPLTLHTAADPGVLVLEAPDGRYRSGESRMEGAFALRLTDPPVLDTLDIRLAPLRLALADGLLDGALGMDGRLEGRVAGAGSLEAFRTRSELTLRRVVAASDRPEGPPPAEDAGLAGGGDPEVAGGEAAGRAAAGGEAAGRAVREVDAAGRTAARSPPRPSTLRLEGTLTLAGEPRRFGGLVVELRDFEPRWTGLLGFDTRQTGRLDGRLELDGTVGGTVDFGVALTHRVPGDSTSRLTGRGSLTAGERPSVDLELRGAPLSLSVLDPFFPNLDMVGVVRGPLSARGTLSELEASADLQTPRGELRFEGRFDLAAERRRYDARVEASRIQLDQWFEGGPRTRLAVRGRVEGEGTDPATLTAGFDLRILPSTLEGARLDTSLLRFRVERGLATVDTFAIRSDVGTFRGRGGFGLASERSAALVLEAEAPDLAAWNRWLVPGRNRARPDTTAADLFRDFPGAEDPAAEVAALPDTLRGSLAARGVIFGNLEEFGFGGRLEGGGLAYGRAAADSLVMTLDVARAAVATDSAVLRGRVSGARYGGQTADSVLFRVARLGPGRSDVGGTIHRGEATGATFGAEVVWREERKAARIGELSLRSGERSLRLEGDSALLVYADSGLFVRGFALVGERGERVEASGSVPRRGEAAFDLRVEALRLAELSRFLAMEDTLSGRMEARLRVEGTADAPVLEGEVRVEDPGLRRLRYGVLATGFSYRDRRLEGNVLLGNPGGTLLRAEGGLKVDLALRKVERRLLEDALDVRIFADSLPLEILTVPIEGVRDVRGGVVGTVRVAGMPDELSLDGEVRLAGGELRVPALATRFTDAGGRVVFRGTSATVDSLGFRSASGGKGVLRGRVGLETPSDPVLELELRAAGLRAPNRRRLTASLDGTARLTGKFREPILTGDVRFSNGFVRVDDFLRQDDVVDLTDPELFALVDTTTLAEQRILARATNPFLQNLRMDATVRVGPDFQLRSTSVNVGLEGELQVRVDRARGDLIVFGEVNLVRGNYRWTSARGVIARQLRITGGRIEFVGTPGVNPSLDITAEHTARTEQGTIVVTAQITGTMTSPVLTFSSDPPLSQSDQICVLLLNSPCAAPGATQLARAQLLGRVSAELSSALASETGLDYLEVRTRGRGEEASEEDDPSTAVSRTEVEVGWYFSPEIFLTVTYPLGQRLPAGSLDWRFADNWSLELRTELRLDQELREAVSSSTIDQERLWGLFLFRDWEF